MINFIGQTIGFAAMGSAMLSNAATSRKRIIIFKLVADVFWVFSSFMIGSYPAAINSTIAISREVIFFNKDKKWAKNILWPIAYSIIFIGAAIITWHDVYSIMPAIASTIATFAFWSNAVHKIKLLVLAQSFMMLVYNVHYRAIAGSLEAVISICTIMISLTIEVKIKKKSKFCFHEIRRDK